MTAGEQQRIRRVTQADGKVKSHTQLWPVHDTRKKEAEDFVKELKKQFDKCNYPRQDLSEELDKLKEKKKKKSK